MKRNKILAFALSLCLTVGLLPTLSASASVKDNNTVKIESKIDKSEEKKDTTTTTTLDLSGITTTPISEDMIKESKGPKTKISKFALKLFAKGIRYSSTAVKSLSEELGGKAGTWVAGHADDVADVLDNVVAAGNLLEEDVLLGIANGLRACGAPSSVADTIANVIVWVFL